MEWPLRDAIMEGAAQRVRPKMMTIAAIMGGLLPIMWTAGTGADVMKRIAALMIGGMVSSTILTLLVIPALYAMWRVAGNETTQARGDKIPCRYDRLRRLRNGDANGWRHDGNGNHRVGNRNSGHRASPRPRCQNAEVMVGSRNQRKTFL